ncbi:MAG: hypothetical protein PHR20_08475, partial [Bacteroidales bacterium]|nr:hypothetical protein [Bacteroidales bacterium]
MDRQRRIIKVIGIVVFLFVLFLTLHDVSNVALEPIWERDAHLIPNGWHFYVDGELRDTNFKMPTVYRGGDLNEKEVRLIYSIQGTEADSRSLMFRTSQKSVTVLLNGDEIYSYDAHIDARRIKVYGYINHFIRIPSTSEGEKLEIITVAHSKKSSEIFYPVYLGTRVSQIISLFKYDGLSLIFGLIILMTAISVVVMAITLFRPLAIR